MKDSGEDQIAKTDDKPHCKSETAEENKTMSDAKVPSEQTASTTKPNNVSAKNWERFQALSQRADTLTKRSTEKRIKHLQKSALEKVQESLFTEEERSILRKHDVKLPSATQSSCNKDTDGVSTEGDRTRILRGHDVQLPSATIGSSKDSHTDDLTTGGVRARILDAHVVEWKGVQKYLGCNDHLLDAASASHEPKSGLEKDIEDAIAAGNIKAAESMSDQLAARNFGVKVSEAFAAREYLKRKKEEEETAKMKKKKKLNWGFVHKQKWETKSNM